MTSLTTIPECNLFFIPPHQPILPIAHDYAQKTLEDPRRKPRFPLLGQELLGTVESQPNPQSRKFWRRRDGWTVTWYDGSAKLPQEVISLLEGNKLPGQGSVIIGTKGTMLLPHVGMPSLFPKKDFQSHSFGFLHSKAKMAPFAQLASKTSGFR